MKERLPINLRAVITNPDAEWAGWEGAVVDVLTEEEIRGGLWARLMAYVQGRPSAGQRVMWLVVQFANGDQVAYERSEVRLINV